MTEGYAKVIGITNLSSSVTLSNTVPQTFQCERRRDRQRGIPGTPARAQAVHPAALQVRE